MYRGTGQTYTLIYKVNLVAKLRPILVKIENFPAFSNRFYWYSGKNKQDEIQTVSKLFHFVILQCIATYGALFWDLLFATIMPLRYGA